MSWLLSSSLHKSGKEKILKKRYRVVNALRYFSVVGMAVKLLCDSDLEKSRKHQNKLKLQCEELGKFGCECWKSLEIIIVGIS